MPRLPRVCSRFRIVAFAFAAAFASSEATAQHEFTFQEGAEGWQFVAPGVFDAPSMSAFDDEGNPRTHLRFAGLGGTNTFGFATTAPMPMPDDPGAVFLATYRVSSGEFDPRTVPQFRLRVNQADFQQATYIAIESNDNGAVSPSFAAKRYSFPFQLARPGTPVIANFDFINFDPADNATADLWLEEVEIQRVDSEYLNSTPRRLERAYSFDSGAEGWTYVSPPDFGNPSSAVSDGALAITGNGAAEQFGFWTSPADGAPVVEAGRLYLMRFRVGSDRAPEDRARNASFRVRVNEARFRSSAFVVVESVGDGAASPAAGDSREYLLQYNPPPETVGAPLLFSFDYLNFIGDDDKTASLRLEDLRVESIANPFAPATGPSVTLRASTDAIVMADDSNAPVAIDARISVPNPEQSGYVLRWVQRIEPDFGGVLLLSDVLNGADIGIGEEQDASLLFSIRAIHPGTYTVEFAAELRDAFGEAGTVLASDRRTVTVEVRAEPDNSRTLYPLAMEPPALPIGATREVLFSTKFSAAQAGIAPTTLLVQRTDAEGGVLADIGVLRDDGVAPDLAGGDLVYTGQHLVAAGTEGFLYFRAKEQPGILASGVSRLAVSRFAVGFPVPGDVEPIAGTSPGSLMMPRRVVVQFDASATPDAIAAAASAVGATVGGGWPDTGDYVFMLPAPGTSEQISAAVETLSSNPLVRSASPSVVGSEDSYTPNDPQFPGQEHLTKVRAHEAWVVARGGMPIAVVDGGIATGHPEFAGRLMLGRDFISGDDDPTDVAGHGTHVAGIAAAAMDNGVGVAGVSGGSTLLIVRAVAQNCPDTAMAAGIRYAVDRGARIVNMSGGVDGASAVLESAANYAAARGALLVASAGNTPTRDGRDVSSVPRFPGAAAASFCVGNSTMGDARAASSRFGPWVDIAAPGEAVLSTDLNDGYRRRTGTSMATPVISGCAAVVWSQHPHWSPEQVRRRLLESSVPLSPTLGIGAGRVDLFEAVFNGSFELPRLDEWQTQGTATTIEGMGGQANFAPRHRRREAMLSTGPSSVPGDNVLLKEFTIQPGVNVLELALIYNFHTLEYPTFLGTEYNDIMRITLISGGSSVPLAQETLNESTLSGVSGFLGGSALNGGQTGWQTIRISRPVTPGPATLRIEVNDVGDGIVDSFVFLDHIRFAD